METALFTMLGAWGVVTALLIIVLIYRSALSTHEDTQIFLDAAENALAKEQRELGTKLNRLSLPITVLIVLSGTLLVASAVVWVWQGLRSF